MRTRDASCSCGQLAVRCVGDPEFVSLCHCLQCQRRTGSAFGLAAFFFRDRVSVKGETGTFARTGDSGAEVLFYFCRACGSTVFWETKRRPDFMVVAVGCFADHDFPRPSRSVYEPHRHVWLPAQT